jgi:hypothetical protein
MRRRTTREWTYNDVLKALQMQYGPIAGIKLSQSPGYIVEECAKEDQPPSAAPEPLSDLEIIEELARKQ